ncbi:ferritin-like domain-containing protein [Asticcacaulis sp. YBE204]|uniref:ferritin-like domain-containing protein n=1 Tax=Asticcacaulis sp. YBE204 TaxID=1282363 RepID=UPI0003C3AF0E|nr:ferritin-like domain-containing protein [Asticcacaulis sp. YBE204]ESQ79764.1 hypothetical protein AEYBE204_07930 [Asticcacaulis sp. YBE204]
MTDRQTFMAALDARVARRESRRDLFKLGGTAAVAAAGASLLASCGGDDSSPTVISKPDPAPTPALTDVDVLNFALNLEYLEAQFYSYAAFGVGLDNSILGGTGTQGAVTGGRKVNFTDKVVEQYAREIAQDEVAHVRFLRTALGSSAVAQPAIDVGAGVDGAFSAAARASGLVGAGVAFDPYATDENFLLGAYIFEDVGVTAYKGAAPLITNKTYLEAAAGILAAEAYHAAIVRTVLYRKGIAAPSLATGTVRISDARDSLDGSSDLDQGILGADSTISNIVPTDASGLTYSRSTGQVLNIVYLNKLAVAKGGFFPNGVNGNIITSTAN